MINEFKVMVIKILTGVKRDMDEHSHNLNREIEKYQTEVIIELENTLVEGH